jgi:hypothetical protein
VLRDMGMASAPSDRRSAQTAVRRLARAVVASGKSGRRGVAVVRAGVQGEEREQPAVRSRERHRFTERVPIRVDSAAVRCGF